MIGKHNVRLPRGWSRVERHGCGSISSRLARCDYLDRVLQPGALQDWGSEWVHHGSLLVACICVVPINSNERSLFACVCDSAVDVLQAAAFRQWCTGAVVLPVLPALLVWHFALLPNIRRVTCPGFLLVPLDAASVVLSSVSRRSAVHSQEGFLLFAGLCAPSYRRNFRTV